MRISLLMVVADNPAASGPRSTPNASEKSPVESPRKYAILAQDRMGKASSNRGERRM